MLAIFVRNSKTTKTETVAYDNNRGYGSYDRNNSDRNNEQRGMGGDRNNDRNNESLFSKRIKAGKRRTYFFDVRATRGNDYFITITESKKRFDDNGYDRHKMFLYKEDFNKFLVALTETIDYVKTDLMPDFDFDAFNHDKDNEEGMGMGMSVQMPQQEPIAILDEPVAAMVADDTAASIEDWKM